MKRLWATLVELGWLESDHEKEEAPAEQRPEPRQPAVRRSS